MGWPEWRVAEVMAARPRIRVNQLGYLLDRPKQATLVSDVKDPVDFTVRDQGGRAVYAGLSQPWSVRQEPTSGLSVHVLDFSSLNTSGSGFQIEAVAASSHRSRSRGACTTRWRRTHCASST